MGVSRAIPDCFPRVGRVGQLLWAAVLLPPVAALIPSAFAQNASPAPQSPNTAAATLDAPSPTPRLNSSTSITVTGDPTDVPIALIRAEAQREVKTEETQRIAVVVPNFNTVISGEGVRLDAKQKLDLAWHTTADPFNLVGAFVLAGGSELKGTNRGFGWGPAGYGKRVGANLADVVDGTMLSGFVYPVLFRQDPRYFREGTGSIGSRVLHALGWAFVGRSDSGRREPNYSNLLGNFSAGAISNTYYPDTGIKLTMVNSAIVTLEGALGNVGLEFAPDIQARFSHRFHSKARSQPSKARSQPSE